jgi:hypothetical protein
MSISTSLFMGLTNFGFKLGYVCYGVLATLGLGKFFIFIFLLLSLNQQCRASDTWHIRSARVCSTFWTEGERK